MSKIRVLVADDSALMRRQLKSMLEQDSRLAVIGTARNGQEAVQKVQDLQPDVVTLDLNMPEMDGLTALTYIMMLRPTPTVVVSSLTQEGALATFEALELGAVDFMPKPSGTVSLNMRSQSEELVSKVVAAATAKMRRQRSRVAARRSVRPARPPQPLPTNIGTIVAIGVSTGGPRTLLDILPNLPAGLPATVVIVQHMPATFTASFAQHLDTVTRLPVKEAEQGETLLPGQAYVAPGGHQMTVGSSALGRGAVARLANHTDEKTMFCPSVNVLFRSVAKLHGRRAVGVLLTGMGDDGADGMVAIRKAGGITIAESEATAVVFGMPREAIERGGAEIVAPSTDIASQIQVAIRRIK